MIQDWLGVGAMFVIMCLTRFVRISGIRIDQKIDKNL